MPTATDDLYNVYLGQANSLTDATLLAEAIERLAVWKDAREAYRKVAAGTLESYAVAGRSYTKRNLTELRDAADRELAAFREIIGTYGGGVALLDFSDGRAV
jgi:hypothetical protein